MKTRTEAVKLRDKLVKLCKEKYLKFNVNEKHKPILKDIYIEISTGDNETLRNMVIGFCNKYDLWFELNEDHVLDSLDISVKVLIKVNDKGRHYSSPHGAE